jgi:Spy/CpxP family protein refolding chaperone
MKMKLIYWTLIFTLLPVSSFSSSEVSFKSAYIGQERREIKSLSKSDIEELENGNGWGLAKAAELNGVPGPVHLLEMKTEIGLSQDQIGRIEILYQEMKRQAISLGSELIEYERELNTHFANRTITEELLRQLLEEIAQVQKQLRYAHLSTHLKTTDILTVEQIDLYNKLRGYFSDDPCKNIPEGHDPEMWKRHNNCP